MRVFSEKEWLGLPLFANQNSDDGILEPGEGTICAACHIAERNEALPDVVVPIRTAGGTVPPVFTDFSYASLGAPKHEESPLTGIPSTKGWATLLALLI